MHARGVCPQLAMAGTSLDLRMGQVRSIGMSQCYFQVYPPEECPNYADRLISAICNRPGNDPSQVPQVLGALPWTEAASTRYTTSAIPFVCCSRDFRVGKTPRNVQVYYPRSTSGPRHATGMILLRNRVNVFRVQQPAQPSHHDTLCSFSLS